MHQHLLPTHQRLPGCAPACACCNLKHWRAQFSPRAAVFAPWHSRFHPELYTTHRAARFLGRIPGPCAASPFAVPARVLSTFAPVFPASLLTISQRPICTFSLLDRSSEHLPVVLVPTCLLSTLSACQESSHKPTSHQRLSPLSQPKPCLLMSLPGWQPTLPSRQCSSSLKIILQCCTAQACQSSALERQGRIDWGAAGLWYRMLAVPRAGSIACWEYRMLAAQPAGQMSEGTPAATGLGPAAAAGAR